MENTEQNCMQANTYTKHKTTTKMEKNIRKLYRTKNRILERNSSMELRPCSRSHCQFNIQESSNVIHLLIKNYYS